MRLVVTCLGARPGALADALRRAGERVREHDLLEARLDRLERPLARDEVGDLLSAAGGRLLATCRPGGPGTPPSEGDRVELLRRLAEAGAAAVDAELGTDAVAAELPDRCERIVSHHEPEDGEPPGPQDARRLVAELRRTGASSLKLAAPAGDAAEALAWMRAAQRAAGCCELTPIPLGPGGRGLRLLAGRGLSSLLYCAEGEPAASGQVRLDEALSIHAAGDCTLSTPLLAIVGWPLAATWSPLLHGTLLRRAGRPGLLVPLPVRDEAAVLPLLEDLGVEAAAITMPHKQALAPRLAALGPRAALSGSLNTLRRIEAGWEGEGFDGPAALDALGGAGALAGLTVLVVGAGGAAAALLAELVGAGLTCVVAARRHEAARAMAARFGIEHARLDSLGSLGADWIVNATPEDPCEPQARRAAFDMRTTPPATDWLRRAESSGLRVVDGLAMLARQAAAQQRWWGRPVEDAAAEACLRELVAARKGESA